LNGEAIARGVSMSDISRKPTSDMCNVRGMGVALRASASTLRASLSNVLCARLRSAALRRRQQAESGNTMSFESRRCVPMTTSTFPASSSARIFFCSAAERKRLTFLFGWKGGETGRLNDSKCWNARTVVGARTANLLAIRDSFERGAHRDFRLTVTNIARAGRRSMGVSRSMSRLMSAMAAFWSLVLQIRTRLQTRAASGRQL